MDGYKEKSMMDKFFKVILLRNVQLKISVDIDKFNRDENYDARINALMFCEIFKNFNTNTAIEKVFNNDVLKREIITFL